MWPLRGYSRRFPSHRPLPHAHFLVFDAIGDRLNILQIAQCLSLFCDFEFRESLVSYSASNSSPTDFTD